MKGFNRCWAYWWNRQTSMRGRLRRCAHTSMDELNPLERLQLEGLALWLVVIGACDAEPCNYNGRVLFSYVKIQDM